MIKPRQMDNTNSGSSKYTSQRVSKLQLMGSLDDQTPNSVVSFLKTDTSDCPGVQRCESKQQLHFFLMLSGLILYSTTSVTFHFSKHIPMVTVSWLPRHDFLPRQLTVNPFLPSVVVEGHIWWTSFHRTLTLRFSVKSLFPRNHFDAPCDQSW